MGITTNDSAKPISIVDQEQFKIMMRLSRREAANNLKKLQDYADILARSANKLMRIAMVTKVTIIFLGALAATSAPASSLLGENNPAIIIFYTIVGLTIATVSGLDAAFKNETRSSGRLILAGNVSAELYEFSRNFNGVLLKAEIYVRKEIIEEDDYNEVQDGYRNTLRDLAEYIKNAHQQAAELGVNLKWEETTIEEKEILED